MNVEGKCWETISEKRKNSGIPVEQYDYTSDAFQQWHIELSTLKSVSLSVNSNTDLFQTETGTINTARIYPNPAKGYVNIDVSDNNFDLIKVYLLDINGRQCRYETISGGGIFKLDLNGLRSGCYILQLKSQNQLSFKKLLVE